MLATKNNRNLNNNMKFSDKEELIRTKYYSILVFRFGIYNKFFDKTYFIVYEDLSQISLLLLLLLEWFILI